jgi:hypothetical protein
MLSYTQAAISAAGDVMRNERVAGTLDSSVDLVSAQSTSAIIIISPTGAAGKAGESVDRLDTHCTAHHSLCIVATEPSTSYDRSLDFSHLATSTLDTRSLHPATKSLIGTSILTITDGAFGSTFSLQVSGMTSTILASPTVGCVTRCIEVASRSGPQQGILSWVG